MDADFLNKVNIKGDLKRLFRRIFCLICRSTLEVWNF